MTRYRMLTEAFHESRSPREIRFVTGWRRYAMTKIIRSGGRRFEKRYSRNATTPIRMKLTSSLVVALQRGEASRFFIIK
jgi:hypothetical protein